MSLSLESGNHIPNQILSGFNIVPHYMQFGLYHRLSSFFLNVWSSCRPIYWSSFSG